MSALDELRGRWWRGWASAFPEDVTSLGLPGHGERLREDEGPMGERELAFHRAVILELERLGDGELDAAERLDRDSMLRVSRTRAHLLDACDHDRRSLELSVYPHAMIAHRMANARVAADLAELEARLERVPPALAAREAALREGRARGHRADADVLRVVTSFALPGAERWYGDLMTTLPGRGLAPSVACLAAARRAGRATLAHAAFLERELGPSAGETAAIGAADYAQRLAWMYGETIDPADLRAMAVEDLARLAPLLVRLGAIAGERRGADIRTYGDALKLVGWLFGEHPTAPGEVFRAYTDAVARARSFVIERRLFDVPSAGLGVIPIPTGMVHGGSATNWPAPLADRAGRGHLAVSLDPGAHSLAFVANLAVHEAIPGHFLQSAAWQAGFADDPSPVRFAAVVDDVAGACGYFGAMPNVEGFAVHAEALMLEHGFYAGEDAVAAVASAIIRAARTIADVDLHAGAKDRSTVASGLAETTGMPRRWCEQQVVRFLRIPGQATTYFLGGRQLRALHDAASERAGTTFDVARFHAALFALGPASPASIRPLLAP